MQSFVRTLSFRKFLEVRANIPLKHLKHYLFDRRCVALLRAKRAEFADLRKQSVTFAAPIAVARGTGNWHTRWVVITPTVFKSVPLLLPPAVCSSLALLLTALLVWCVVFDGGITSASLAVNAIASRSTRGRSAPAAVASSSPLWKPTPHTIRCRSSSILTPSMSLAHLPSLMTLCLMTDRCLCVCLLTERLRRSICEPKAAKRRAVSLASSPLMRWSRS
jgi:hypothetical protein